MHISKGVLSFDDGRRDNYTVAMEVLKKENLPATFNITSGYIEKTIPLNELCPNEPMSKEEVVSLSEIPIFEIAGHGYAHLNTFEDWNKGIEKLKTWLGEDYFKNGYGIASPHSIVTDSWLLSKKDEFLKTKIKYIRTGLKNQFEFKQRVISRISRMTGSKVLTYIPIKNSLKPVYSRQKLYYSVQVLNSHSFEQIKYLIEKTVQKKGDIILTLHSVLKHGEDYYDDLYSWEYEKFVKLCTYLCEMRNKGLIDVKKNIDIIE